MKSEFGTMKRVYCKLAPNQHVTETRSMALEEFARTLDKDQVHAVHASRTEWHIEGPYWLALLLGKAEQTDEDKVRLSLSLEHVFARWGTLGSTS